MLMDFATNCLILVNVDPAAFDNLPHVQQELAAFGTVVDFRPLTTFRRLLVTYEATADAATAKSALSENPPAALGADIKVYFLDVSPEFLTLSSFNSLTVAPLGSPKPRRFIVASPAIRAKFPIVSTRIPVSWLGTGARRGSVKRRVYRYGLLCQ
jgi:hypothetical protein